MIPAVGTRGLVKDYGRTRALQGVDLQIMPGELFGFLGPNGAGKSTTIRLLMDVLRPTAGTIEVFETPRPPEARGCGRASATCPGSCRSRHGPPPGSTCATSRPCPPAEEPRAAELAERFALDLSRPLRELSKGNRQ